MWTSTDCFLIASGVIKPKVNIKAAVQPVSILYNGSLQHLQTLQPKIDAEQLSRELVVRKLELDVEALEKLRQRDDELARQAAEALRQQNEDWGVTEKNEGQDDGAGSDASGNQPTGQQSSTAQTDTHWQSAVTPYGPYGSAYEPLEKAEPDPAAKPARKKRRVKVQKKKVKNNFEEIFNF